MSTRMNSMYSNKPPANYICRLCNCRGHYIDDCWLRNESPPRFPDQKRINYVCKRCKRPGHYIENCPLPYIEKETMSHHIRKKQKIMDKRQIKKSYKLPPAHYLCNKCKVPGHWIDDCPLDIPSPSYKCKLCGLHGHFVRNCHLIQDRKAYINKHPKKPYTNNKQRLIPKERSYHINNDEYCPEPRDCKYCQNPTNYHQYLTMGYIKKWCYEKHHNIDGQRAENTEFESAPFQIIEIIITFFDINSEFFAEIRNRNNYLLSYNKVHQSIKFHDISTNMINTSCGIVIYDDGGIYYHAGQLYTHKSVPPQAYTKYQKQNNTRFNKKNLKNGRCSKGKGYRSLFMKKYLSHHQVSILRRLINKHCFNKTPYKDERLLGNKWHCCGGGYQLIQALYCKVEGKIGKYDAYCTENKNSDLWKFLNEVYDRIAGHHCSGHAHLKTHAPVSIPIPIGVNIPNKSVMPHHNHRHQRHHDKEMADGHGMDLMMFCEVGAPAPSPPSIQQPPRPGIPYLNRPMVNMSMAPGHGSSRPGARGNLVFNTGNEYIAYPMSSVINNVHPMHHNVPMQIPTTLHGQLPRVQRVPRITNPNQGMVPNVYKHSNNMINNQYFNNIHINNNAHYH